jgi:hypothetical protein
MAIANNTSLTVADLDFFSIKNNLKTFLRSQSEFTDYDFDASGLSVLLDVLAYNTYYNAFYLNMAANEAFLDTAQLRQNILSQAKLVNYIPASRQGALAKINILVTPSLIENQQINFITLDRYTRVIGRDINGINYPFVTINANTSSKSGGTFLFSNVFIKQGEVVTMQFQANTANPKRRFEIPSANVDTTTITVAVQESSSNTYTEQYTLNEDLTEISANSTVYFMEENENLNYTIYFGDDVLGKKPKNGNIVTVTYLDTAGAPANNINTFTFTSRIAGLFRDNVSISTVSSSTGGTDKETDDQVKFRAPYFYSAQNRAVTKDDYESLITKDYNNIDSVSIWGGEENDPVIYGKVFVALKTKGFFALTDLEKEEIKNNLIRSRNVLTVMPEIVDPDYCFLLLRGKVTYNPVLTQKTADELLSTVRQAIEQYNDDQLNTFRSIFKLSKLQQYIESSEPSITGSDLNIYLQKQIDIENNKSRNYIIKFGSTLRKGDIQEKLFSFPQIVVFDNANIERQVFIEEVPESYTGVGSVVVLDAGTNYTTAPTVTISGDGTGATAYAKIVNRRVVEIIVTNKGYNYTRATVSITGGDGVGATAFAKVENNYGTLRTFYFKSNGEKVIVSENAGTIDYLNGIIELTSLLTNSVVLNQYYDENVLTVNAVAADEIIYPSRSRIFAIDMNNPQSIQLEIVEGR